AIALASGIGHRFIEAETTARLAAAQRGAGQLAAAADHAGRGLDLARRCRYRVVEGQATTILAAVHLARGQADLAADLADQALRVHTETGHRLGEAQAHVVASHALRAGGEEVESARHLEAAGALFVEIGADEAAQTAILVS